MKDRQITSATKTLLGIVCTAFPLFPMGSLAQPEPTPIAAILPVEMTMTSFLIIGALLLISIIMFFVFQARFHTTRRELKDITNELGHTRERLTETRHTLEKTESDLKHTTQRYQGILFDAEVGMFQVDLSGKCTYINTAMQELSGLYPKKALREGLPSALHPDDRELFKKAWADFTQDDVPFNLRCRFKHAKGREVHVVCKASKVLNERKDVETYIGWVSDVTYFHEEQLQQETCTARYSTFIEETIEGYYQLTPETPIPLNASAEKMATAIMGEMTLTACNDTFAAMYGTTPVELNGKALNTLQGGCGPFKNTADVKDFIETEYKAIDFESVRKDPRGNRLNLLNNVIGLIEDKKLVGIWGMQRNISQQKREKTELTNQAQFMRRILDALPADVHVKDTSCRYLYASQKLAERTGISQEDWIGKTILEVMPATPRDHDKTAIEVMKSNTLSRIERPYEAQGKSGWMETIQIPLVSAEGLVEGIVGLSLDVSERKNTEETVRKHSQQLEQQLKHRTDELQKSKSEHGTTAITLRDTNQKLKIREAELENRSHEFKKQLDERKRAEQLLRRNEEILLTHQQQLEEKLTQRLAALDTETNKRKKWEDLLSIKETELRKIEEHAVQLKQHFEKETALREQTEANLKTQQAAVEKYRRELADLTVSREQEVENLKTLHQSTFRSEHIERTKAEKQLDKTQTLLQHAQEKVKQLIEQHSLELEREVGERKATAEKLIQNMEELDELRQQFNQRIEEETKSIKQELAQKQIREKSLRQHEKDLGERIKDLEKSLQMKAKGYAEQIQAREGAEVQKQQIEQKLDMMNKRQQELIARETQKLNINIAEIRLEEIKLRKLSGDLEQEKDGLEETLKIRTTELEQAGREIQKTESLLAESQLKLKQLSDGQTKLIAQETEGLRQQLEALKQSEDDLNEQLDDLQQEKKDVEQNLEIQNGDLAKVTQEFRSIFNEHQNSKAQLKQLAEDQENVLANKTAELNHELQQLRTSEKALQHKEQELQEHISKQQGEARQLQEQLKTETSHRDQAEKDLRELQIAFGASQENTEALVVQQTQDLSRQVELFKRNENFLKKDLEAAQQSIEQRDGTLSDLTKEREQTIAQLKETESRLSKIRQEHQTELRKSLAEVQEVSRMNSELVDELNDTVQDTLNPVVKTAIILEQADNLLEEQKLELATASHNCRTLIDMMNYRSELTHSADGSGEVQPGECDLHQLMTDIDQQFCHRAETKKIFFAVSFAQYQAANNIPKLIETDEHKVRKTLSILVGYAIEKTKKGRLSLHATRKPSEGDSTNIAFELTYTGDQSQDALLSGIFGSDTGEDKVDLKYGLTLVRRYISMLDGTVTLEYRNAGVTAITVGFPFKRLGSELILPANEDEKQAGAA